MPASPSASLALQSAVVTALIANADLTTATGGAPRIFVDVPPATPYPYWSSPLSVESRLLLPDGGMERLLEGCGAGVAQA